MIPAIMRAGFMNLRRDRAALALTFVLPIVFFTIFAGVFGKASRQGIPAVRLAIVDQDGSDFSRRLAGALHGERALRVLSDAEALPENSSGPLDDDAAQAAVRAGRARVALIIPKGFGSAPMSFGPASSSSSIQMLYDSSDPIAPQVVAGIVQKASMTSMPDALAGEGVKYLDKMSGGLTPDQRTRIDQQLESLRSQVQSTPQTSPQQPAETPASGPMASGIISLQSRDVVGEKKDNPAIAFYAAGIGVMLLLFTATGAGGTLLEEAESGTLDRILSTRVNMTRLLIGKLLSLSLIGLLQLTIMFLWGAAVFRLELLPHVSGLLVMGSVTALAASAFGLMLAAASRTRAQLGALSTILILPMSALGGSMFPRFMMPEGLQKLGLITFNAWALDGFTKVLWRDERLWGLWPQVTVLAVAAVVFFAIARRLARKWEYV